MTKSHPTTKLVVRNLSPQMTAQGLRAHFASHGSVRSVRLATDIMTGTCRGVGFVSLDEADNGAALAALDGSSLGGRTISVTIEPKPVRT